MSRLRTWALAVVTGGSIAAGIAGSGCTTSDAISPDGSTPPPPGFKLVPDVQKVLTNSVNGGLACSTTGSCHGSGLGGLTFTAVQSSNQLWTLLTQTPGADTKIVVNVTNFSVSELLTKPDSAVPTVSHVGGKIWSSSPGDPSYPSYQTVMRWASNGALDN